MTSIFSIVTFIITSFYSLQFTNIDGQQVNMNSFQGKKVLLVNIATNDSHVSQLSGLQQLQTMYADSLVVIGFPSNSFGNESRTNAEIKQFCSTNYGVTFLLAEKKEITGSSIQTVYNWLKLPSENGALDGSVVEDFQKFLIDKEGNIVGTFSPKVDPLSPLIQNAITGN